LLALVFILAGFMKVTGFAGTVGYVGTVLPMPEVMTALAIIFELGGGLMLLVGFHARIASLGLVVFTAVATVFFHLMPYLSATDPMAIQMQMLMILKNLAIMGGLLQVFMNGAGSWSWNKQTGVCTSWCPDCKDVETKKMGTV
jgi:putative oxidoreductase